MCFVCAEDGLKDYRIRGGRSFITSGNKPSAKFRSLAQSTKLLKGERERQLKRWTQWDIDKQAKKKIDPEVMTKLSIEYDGGEDWVQALCGGRVSIIYACLHCKCAPMRMNGWVRCKAARQQA
eukprot:4094257-Amphidinium_carterae.1